MGEITVGTRVHVSYEDGSGFDGWFAGRIGTLADPRYRAIQTGPSTIQWVSLDDAVIEAVA
jgi:hypothetical protein